jgi:preprotein translocase SecF subunit
MRWFENPNFDFTGSRYAGYIISGILFFGSLISIMIYGLDYGIDFEGGKEFVISLSEPVNAVEISNNLAEPLNGAPEVKRFGSNTDLLIRTDNQGEIGTVQNLIVSTVEEEYPGTEVSVVRTDIVGPRFAEDLKRGALNAIIFSIIIIAIYILIRFKNWTFSAGVIAALIHDVVITLGVITVIREIVPFSLQIDQTIIAAFMTLVGYSLNDTVVIYDRIRENLLLRKSADYEALMNKSLNETLSRTVITSLTTLFVVLILFLFGGETLKGFSFTLIIGLILGTYSSLYVASPIVLDIHNYKSANKK